MSCSHQGTERFPKGCQGQITKVMGILLPVHEGIKGAEGGRPEAEGKHWQSRTRDGENVLPAFPGKKGLWIDRDGWLLPATDLRCSEGKEIHAVWMRARTAWEGSCGAELRASSTGSEGSRRGMPGRDLGAAVGRARGSAAAGEAGKGSGIPWNDPGLEPGLDAEEQGCIGIPRGTGCTVNPALATGQRIQQEGALLVPALGMDVPYPTAAPSRTAPTAALSHKLRRNPPFWGSCRTERQHPAILNHRAARNEL